MKFLTGGKLGFRTARLLVAAGAFALLMAAPAAADVTELISSDPSGNDTMNGSAYGTSMSADGRYVAFQSYSPEYAGDETDYNDEDVFVRDRQSGVTKRISLAFDGSDLNFGGSPGYAGEPSVSANGRYVAFNAVATNVVDGFDSSGLHRYAYVYDRQTGITEPVSVDHSDPSVGANAEVQYTAISGDGRYVVFNSGATNLVPGAAPNGLDVFLFDRDTDTTKRISTSVYFGASSGGRATSFAPSISADGRFIAFRTQADDIVANDTNNAQDVFVYDRVNGTTELVTKSSAGSQKSAGSGGSQAPSLSADGRYVTFQDAATGLVSPEPTNPSAIYLRDRQLGKTTIVNVSTGGAESNREAHIARISGDGGSIVFFSDADNLAGPDGNDTQDVFLRDLAAGTTERVSNSTTGGDPEGFSDFVSGTTFHGSQNAVISANGRLVGFESDAFNLTPGAVNDGANDVYVTDRDAVPPPVDTGGGDGTGGGSGGDTGGGGGGGDTGGGGSGGDTGGGGGSGGDTGGGGSGGDTGGGGTGDGSGDGGSGSNDPPVIAASAKSKQKLGKKLKLVASCDDDCSVKVTGKLKAGSGKKGKSKLVPDSEELDAGDSTTLKPKLSGKGIKAAKKALKKGKSVTASLLLTATSTDGDQSQERFRVKVS